MEQRAGDALNAGAGEDVGVSGSALSLEVVGVAGVVLPLFDAEGLGPVGQEGEGADAGGTAVGVARQAVVEAGGLDGEA